MASSNSSLRVRALKALMAGFTLSISLTASAQLTTPVSQVLGSASSLKMGRETVSTSTVKKAYEGSSLYWRGGSLNPRLQELLVEASLHGIPTAIFWNAADENTSFTYLQNGEQINYEIFMTWKAIRVSRALFQGMVLPEKVSDQVKFKTKETSPQYWTELKEFLAGNISAREFISELTPKTPAYEQLLNVYDRLTDYPEMDPASFSAIRKNILKIGKPADSLALRALLDRLDFQGYAVHRSANSYDAQFAEVVKAFQYDHGLTVDGIVGGQVWDRVLRTKEELRSQIAVNLDRLRWLPQVFESENIQVNLAKQHLVYTKDSHTEMAFITINGRTDRKTPLMRDNISFAELNPTWTVPYSILIKDKLPALKEDPSKIYDWKMKVYDDISGKEINPSSVNWNRISASNMTYTFIQSPGPHNALGKVKFPMENPWAIYLHDTNTPNLFVESNRLLSSGCVRLSQPLEFAERVINQSAWNVSRMRDVTEFNPDPKTQKVQFGRKIPVYLMYQTVDTFGENGILFLKDSYGIDQAQYNQWKSL